MDRNGEWASRRMLSRMMGHREGAVAIKRVVKAAIELNIDVLTLFAFSTENWLRPETEVSFLMNLLEEYVEKEGKELSDNGVRVLHSGKSERLPPSTKAAVDSIVEKTKENDRLILNIALDYGGKDEIAYAARCLALLAKQGEIDPCAIDENLFAKYLYHPEIPDIDLMIRTGEEQRISNFMLWRVAYAELFFSKTYWPDFTKEDLEEGLNDFSKRKRRFGGIR
jgi:undecaprenyl diphosphate synthase